MKLNYILLFSSLSLNSHLFGADANEKIFKGSDFKIIKINLEESNLKINGSSEPDISVKYKKLDYEEKNCAMEIIQKGDTIEIDVEGQNKNADCEVDFVINLPKKVKIEASVDMGDLKVDGMDSTIDYKVGAGDVKLNGNYENAELKLGKGDVDFSATIQNIGIKLGTGKISGEGFVKEGKISTGAGDVKLVYLEEAKDVNISIKSGVGDIDFAFNKKIISGKLDVKTGVGDTSIRMPEGSKIDTDYKSGIGSLKNHIGDTKNADFRIRIKTGAGGLVIDRI